MDSRIETLLKYGDHLFEKKRPLDSLNQEIAENFYPERADFTTERCLGTDFAANLTTSYPILARRELGNSFSSMLRPVDQEWFSIETANADRVDNEGKRWLEWAGKTQRRATYDRVTQFVRATKEGDHDFAGFGQCVISAELNRTASALLYRCWHLRDVAWCEGYEGKVSEIHRKWAPTARELSTVFPGKVSAETMKLIEKKTPYTPVKCRHVVVPSEQYEGKWKTPWVSVYFEAETGHILEEIGVHNQIYIIPRWQTVSGSQYAFSPATVAALPDARLMQAMTLVLLEAGEKAVNPPLVATQEVVRSDMQLFAGGVTWVDAEYDERLGDALRPLTIDSRGIPIGMDMRNDIKEMIKESFYLNKIGLPPADTKAMTAYEIGQRVQEYIRNALPLFEPAEMDYNGAVCEHTFDLLMRAGAFGSPDQIPDSIKGADVKFRFESPLHKAIDKQKGQLFQEARAMLAEAMAVDTTAAAMIDVRTALRDVLDGIGVPAEWVRDEEQMKVIDLKQAQQQQAQQMLSMMEQGGAAAEQIGKAGTAINEMKTGI